MPEWIDRHTLVAGDVADLSIPPLWKFLSSAGLQLVHVYASPSIARLLVQTGLLTNLAPRRLAETGKWKEQATLPGGLLRGAPGYVGTAQVRLLHARVRATAITHGWHHTELGLPTNQVDVARTWLDFTTVPFLAWRKLGIVFTEEEQVERYRYWSYLGYLLGLDERFYLDIRNDDDAEALLDLLDSTIAEPDENSRLLTDAMLEAKAEQLSAGPLSMVDRAALRDLLNGLVRYYFGDRFADALHLPPAQSAGLIPLLAAAGAQSWQMQRSTPEGAALALEQFTAMTVTAVTKQMPDGTAYQLHLAAEAQAA